MSEFREKLDSISENIHVLFGERDEIREKIIPLSREVIHYCSITIRAVHRQEFTKANELLQKAAENLTKTKTAAAGMAKAIVVSPKTGT